MYTMLDFSGIENKHGKENTHCKYVIMAYSAVSAMFINWVAQPTKIEALPSRMGKAVSMQGKEKRGDCCSINAYTKCK